MPLLQALFAVGVSLKSYTIMIFGRILFGLGGESQGVAQSTLVAIWFGEREIALALGINLSISRLGSVWNDNMSPVMFDYAGTQASLDDASNYFYLVALDALARFVF